MKRCDRHPRYKGKRKPKSECLTCLQIYLTLLHERLPPIKPNKVFRDKSKYKRKPKHKDPTN